MKNHKPVVVSTSDYSMPPYCRLCGVPVETTFSKNGRHPTFHSPTDPARYPILDGDLKPVS